MSVSDPYRAVILHDDASGAVEVCLISASNTRCGNRHQQLAVRAVLINLMSDMLGHARRNARFAFGRAVGDPNIALLVDEQSVREANPALAEAFDEFAIEGDLN